MPHSTHFSSHPELFQATASQRNLHTIQPSPQQSLPLQAKAAMPRKAQCGADFRSLREHSLPHGASTKFPESSLDPTLSLKARENKRTSLHNLTFAAAIAAASLQLLTLPGLTIESQQNSSQLGRADDVEIMYAQSNLNDFSWKTSIKSFLSIISVILSVVNLYLILAKTNKLEKKNEKLRTEIKEGLDILKKDLNQSIDNLSKSIT